MDQPAEQFSDELPIEGQDGQDGDEAAAQRQRLESLLAARLVDAVNARMTSGIEEIWREDQDQYDGIDNAVVTVNKEPAATKTVQGRKPQAGARSRVYLNITKPKTDTAISRVQEMLIPHDDKPWEIGPTPVPELNKAADGQDERQVQLATGEMVPAQQVAKALLFKADEAAKAMSEQIEDWFVEGKVYAELRKVIRSAGRLGTGVIKGPVPCSREDKRWDVQGGVATISIKERIAPTSVAKSVWDIFPDPSCGEDIHDGAYLFERDYMTGRRLRALAKLPEYDQAAIAEILAEGPRGRSRFDDRPSREKDGQANTLESDTFEVWYYYGDIPPEELLAGGWTIQGFNDAAGAPELAKQVEQAMQLTTVPIVATMVNDRVVRMSMNPLETGAFPFDFFVWEPVDDQPWGRGMPRKMATAQKMLNASTRAMLENAGMSAGPQVIIDRERIVPANGQYEITGRKLWYWAPGDEVKDVRFAFASVMIDSAQEQLQAIIEFSLRMADELSNMPLLLQGIVGNQAPETLGGQAMAEANATSPLKAIAKQFDDQIIVPHLTRYYDWGMQDPNVPAEAKGDMKCSARGASALIYRDVAAQFLPQLLPMVNDPKYKIDPSKWMEELLRGNKVNPRSIQYTDEQAKAIEEQQAQQPPPVDPRIEAAKVNAEAKAADREATVQLKQAQLAHDAEQRQADRESDELVASIEREIQVMEFAGNKQVSLEGLRAMLASKAMDVRNKRELFVAEKQFAETTGEGRGL